MYSPDITLDGFDANTQAQDERLAVKMYVKSMRDSDASEKEGRPIYRDVDYIEIRVPGSRDGVARRITEGDKQRFPRHYAAFKLRVETPLEGTPLKEWGVISRSMAEELAFFNIKTVEQLAGLNDGHAQHFQGIQEFKRKAVAWLETTKENASVAKMQAELAERDDTIKALSERVKDFEEKMEALINSKPKADTRKTRTRKSE